MYTPNEPNFSRVAYRVPKLVPRTETNYEPGDYAHNYTCTRTEQKETTQVLQTKKHSLFPLVYKLIELALISSVLTASVERLYFISLILNCTFVKKIMNLFFFDI